MLPPRAWWSPDRTLGRPSPVWVAGVRESPPPRWRASHHQERWRMRTCEQDAGRRGSPRVWQTCRLHCPVSRRAWTRRPRDVVVSVRAALQNPFSLDGPSPWPAGSRACLAGPELRHPPAGLRSRYRGGSGLSSAARSARGLDAMKVPFLPSLARDGGGRSPARRACGDRAPDQAPASTPVARTRVSQTG